VDELIMAKKQTRRSISFSRTDFELAQAAAQRDHVPLAQLAAEALHEYLQRRGAREQVTGPATACSTSETVNGTRVAGPVPVDRPPATSVPPLDSASVDSLIERSSVGAGLRDIEQRGIEAHLVDLEQEMHATDDVQVVYDEQAPRRAATRKRR
jgi:hypothetical protein